MHPNGSQKVRKRVKKGPPWPQRGTWWSRWGPMQRDKLGLVAPVIEVQDEWVRLDHGVGCVPADCVTELSVTSAQPERGALCRVTVDAQLLEPR